MAITNALAGIAVRDMETSVRWYSRLLDRMPDRTPMPEVAEWEFADGGWIQVFHDKQRAGSSSVTLVESSLEATIGRLESETNFRRIDQPFSHRECSNHQRYGR